MVEAIVLLGGGVGIVVLLGLSAFFSSSEIAIFSLPPDWGEDPNIAGHGSVDTLKRLTEDPHRLLVTILVGNNLVNVAIASVTTAVSLEFLPRGEAVTVATIGASFVVLVFGEIVPKSYGLGRGEWWALRVARPLAGVEWLLTPLVIGFDAVTRALTPVIGGELAIEAPYVDDSDR